MLWFLAACSPDPGSGPSDTDPPSSPPTAPTLGRDEIRLRHSALVDIVSDGARTLAVDDLGGVLLVGDTWEDVHGPVFDDRSVLRSVDARDGTVWAVAYDALGAFDGETWTLEPLPQELWDPSSVVARRDGTVAVLKESCDYVCHSKMAFWDGTTWTIVPETHDDELLDLVETESGELVAVGYRARVVRWDGATWVELYRGQYETLYAVATHGDEIVAVGNTGLVVRGPLDALTVEVVGSGEDILHAVDVGTDGRVWALGETSAWLDDGGWTAVTLPDGDWTRIAATDDGALLAGARGGPTVVAGGAAGWEDAWRGASLGSVRDIWVDAEGTAWLGAGGAVGRWNAAGLEILEMPNDGEIRAISGSGPNDLVVLDGGILAWDGTRVERIGQVVQGAVWDVAVLPDGTAFVAGSEGPDGNEVPRLLRRDAGVWTVDPAPIPTTARELRAIVAFSRDDVYVLTGTWPASLLRFDGRTWTVLAELEVGYQTLWGRSGTDLYLGKDDQGFAPRLLHWDGATPTEVPGAPEVRAIAGTETALVVLSADTASRWEDGVWTELMVGSGSMAVGTRGDTAVLTDGYSAVRGPLSDW